MIIGLLFSHIVFASENGPTYTSNSVQQCRQISSILERLDCYDKIEIQENSPVILEEKQIIGIEWNRAQNQESQRNSKDLKFILTSTEEPNPSVVITTPALGFPSPRPILMLSCIDNITRLQVTLPKSLTKKQSIQVQLNTEKTQFSSQWFVREEGVLLEASRGLDGIKEIQRLFNANTLKIQLENNMMAPLVFNIEQLTEIIKPLRSSCHW